MQEANRASDNQTDAPVNDDQNRLSLENEKLKLEIEELRSKNSLENRIARYVPAITAAIAFAGLWFGFYQFQSQQKQAADQRQRETNESLKRQESELARANDAKEQEFRKPFWEKQLQLYFDATEAASTMATSKDARRRDLAGDRFWELYWGSLAVVEDAGLETATDAKVEAAMVHFGSCFNGMDECDQGEKEQRSLALAHTVRDTIAKSWNVHMADLPSRPQ